ncbi:MAG TPA: ABC transporter substrate-binding protein [Candidatus Limnocylindrales bacterium]
MRSRRAAMAVALVFVLAGAMLAACQGTPAATTNVKLQLQWAPQAQFAGYFAAKEEGYYAAEGLNVEILDGGPDVIPQVVGSDANGPEFTISWLPKVLEVRDKGQSDLVNIAQVFQRSGTLSVAWADSGISSPADFSGKKVGVWDFGNEYEVIAGAKKAGLEQGTDFTKVIQPFDMTLLLNAVDGCAADATNCVDVAEAMIYNEYAQVLEATNPATNALYQPGDLNVINYNEVGTAMLQDGIFARAAWLAQAGNEDVAVKFLRASFKGWMFCRDNPAKCIEYTVAAGSTLGAGHQAWMMNEINPLIWPSPNGIGQMPTDIYQQTVDIALDAGILAGAPGADAYRTDLAERARQGVTGDLNGNGFVKGTVTVTPGGE